jgi:hypothetical protein
MQRKLKHAATFIHSSNTSKTSQSDFVNQALGFQSLRK